MNVKELVDIAQSQILAETIDDDTLYNVKDLRPILRLTNAQMRVPSDPDTDETSTSKGLVQLDDIVLCVDDGTYKKNCFYQYKGYDWLMVGSFKIDSSISASSTNDNPAGTKAVYDYAEAKTNKVTSISSSSTATQYPSASAVYNYAEAKSNKSTTLSSSSTTTQYPSSKTVYDFVLAQLGNYALKSSIEIREV